MLAVPVLVGLGGLTACTGTADAPAAPAGSSSASVSPGSDLALENAWVRESILLQRARGLGLDDSVRVLTAHVEALLAAGVLGLPDYAGPVGPDSVPRFVRGLDAAADDTQRAVVETDSGSHAALLASIAGSDAALAASLRGVRG